VRAIERRRLLAGTALLFLSAGTPRARIVAGALPWQPDAGSPPLPVRPGPWQFFTPEEGAAVEALVDRLIPPDDKFPGGKDAGCAVYIDRQLAGPYGTARAATTWRLPSWTGHRSRVRNRR
jgi:gluconate 2-dehydrogenase gamma chain